MNAAFVIAVISSLGLMLTIGSQFLPRAKATQPVIASSVTERPARLEPALSLPSYTNSRLGQDFRDNYSDAQLAISSGNLIFYAQGTQVRALDPVAKRIVWQQPLPWLFSAWRDLFITADQRGIVTAYTARTQKQVWSVQAFTRASTFKKTRFLRVIGNLLIVNSQISDRYSYMTSALEPATGRTVWTKDTPAPYARSVYVARDRYIIHPTQSDSPMGSPPSSFLDTKTGWYFERDESILNQNSSGSEFVKLEYLRFLPPHSDHELKESYSFRLSILSNTERSTLIQDLGVFDLTPPLECLGKQFFVGLYSGSDPAYTGQIFTTISGAVSFLAVNADTVWLEVANDCGRRLAYISRRTRVVSYLNVPETLSLEQRYAQYRSSDGRISLVQGRIPVQIHMNLFGEGFALATVRNSFALKDIVWLEQRGERVYALLRNKELKIYDSNATLLERYFLALPSLEHEPNSYQVNRLDSLDRVFTWRSGSIGKSYFFVLPS